MLVFDWVYVSFVGRDDFSFVGYTCDWDFQIEFLGLTFLSFNVEFCYSMLGGLTGRH